jgi:hypothetical protein
VLSTDTYSSYLPGLQRNPPTLEKTQRAISGSSDRQWHSGLDSLFKNINWVSFVLGEMHCIKRKSKFSGLWSSPIPWEISTPALWESEANDWLRSPGRWVEISCTNQQSVDKLLCQFLKILGKNAHHAPNTWIGNPTIIDRLYQMGARQKGRSGS